MSVFITGTGTDVGKTVVSAWLCAHTNATYWKPVQTGSNETTDTETVKRLANVRTIKEKYLLREPLSPHAAAAQEGVEINMDELLEQPINSTIVEGAGGVLVPLNHNYTMIDYIKALKIPVIVVASSALGTINHSCLTIEVLRTHHVPVLGVIMNGPHNFSNKKAIEHYGKTQVLAELPIWEELSKRQLLNHPLPEKLQKALSENLTH